MRRILITGGAGFLGSHICDRLIRDGHECRWTIPVSVSRTSAWRRRDSHESRPWRLPKGQYNYGERYLTGVRAQ